MAKAIGFIVGLTLVIVIAFGISVGLTFTSGRLLKDMNAQVAATLIAFIVSTILALWTFQRTKEKEAESRHFVERAKVYDKLIKFLQYFHFHSKGWVEEIPADELAKGLGEVRYDMIIWGGKETIRAIMKLEDFSEGMDHGVMFLAVSELYAAIRKDLGHKDDKALSDDLVLQQIVNEERWEARAKIDLARKAR